jgi:hypothetical protein
MSKKSMTMNQKLPYDWPEEITTIQEEVITIQEPIIEERLITESEIVITTNTNYSVIKHYAAKGIYKAIVRSRMARLLKGLHRRKVKLVLDSNVRYAAGFEFYRKFTLRQVYNYYIRDFTHCYDLKNCYESLYHCFGISSNLTRKRLYYLFQKWRSLSKVSVVRIAAHGLFYKCLQNFDNRYYIRKLARGFNLWRKNLEERQFYLLSLELQKKPKEIHKEIIREVVKEVEVEQVIQVKNKKSVLKSVTNHTEKLQNLFFLSRYFRRWKAYLHHLRIYNLNLELSKPPKEIIERVEITKIIENKEQSMKSACHHIEYLQRNYFLTKFCSRWRDYTYKIQLNLLRIQMDNKEKEVIVEVPILKEEIIEVVKEVTNKKSGLKKACNHSDQVQKIFFLARYCRRWRSLVNQFKMKLLRVELESQPREVTVEVVKEIIKPIEVVCKKSVFRSTLVNCEKTQREHILGKCFRKWREYSYQDQLLSLQEALQRPPREVFHTVEILKEVTDKKTIIRNTVSHVHVLQNNFFLARACRKWRELTHFINVDHMRGQIKLKPKEIIKEVEVVYNEVVEVVKEVVNKKSTIKNAVGHIDRSQNVYFLAKFCRRWRDLIRKQNLNALYEELEKKPVEIIKETEVIKTVTNKKSVMQRTVKHTDLLVNNFFLSRYCRRWRNQARTQIISELNEELKCRPRQIVNEIVKEVPITKCETIEIMKDVYSKIIMLMRTSKHSSKIQKLFFLGKFMRRWRTALYQMRVNELMVEINKKPREILVEVIKEIEVIEPVQVVKEIFVEVSVTETIEVVKEVVNKKSVVKSVVHQTDRAQNNYFLAKYCRRWRGLVYTMRCNQIAQSLRISLNPYLENIK